MPQVQLLKEPGYVYDLNFIFYLKFNFQQFIDTMACDMEKTDAIKHYKHVLAQFGDISDDLYVFYHAIENGRCFMTTCYIKPYAEQFVSAFHSKFLLDELCDQDRLIRRLLAFYFYDLSQEEIEACVNSQIKLLSCVKDSTYSDAVKRRLYEFMINPVPYIHRLQFELIEKERQLSEYYKQNYEKIIDIHNQSSFEIIRERMRDLDDISFLDDGKQVLYVTYCLLNNFMVSGLSVENGLVYVLGVDYERALGIIKEDRRNLNIREFCNALSDESRMQIVNLLLEEEEIICKDLERIFDFSGSTAYHHITILTKAGVLKTRNDKKTILYSLNRQYFDKIIQALRKYSSYRKG